MMTSNRPNPKRAMNRHRGWLWWMPPPVATFIYTVFFKPRPLRKLLQKLICRIIPKEIEVNGVTLVLNPADAIISGSLTLGIYETYNIAFFQTLLRSNICVLDVGANIGLYSALAAKHVGAGGRVVAVEPDSTNCSFLKKTVRRNGFGNVTVIEKAAGDKCGPGNLYLCELNKAHHRIYDPPGTRPHVPIEMTTLDALVEELSIPAVDILKLDAEGSECLVLNGMRRLLRANPNIRIITEFWPWGIEQTGGSSRQYLEFFREAGFAFFELDSYHKRLKPVHDFDALLRNNLERQHVDLYLEPKSAATTPPA